MYETTIMDTSATSRTGGPRDMKTGQSRMPNWTIQFSHKQQLFLIISASEEHRKMDLLLPNPETCPT
jgi:hypothetical protein